MSEKALRDLNSIPGSERRNENSSKGSIAKPVVGSNNGIHDEGLKKNNSSLEEGQNRNNVNLEEGQKKTSRHLEEAQKKDNGNLEEAQKKDNGNLEEAQKKDNGNLEEVQKINSVNGETANSEIVAEVEYIESENLNDLEDADLSLKTLLAGLDSKDWVLVCEALNNARRFSLHHKELLLEILGDVISLVVKCLKNPRSAVCKTAIMTSADIFSTYNDDIIESLDPLLVQLLLKSSQDKRFVCDAAEKALVSMTTWVSPLLLLPKLQPYLKHKNPRIRAKASMCVCRSVPRLGVEGIKAYGIDKLIQTAACQLSDQLPESREAARKLLLELQSVYQKCPQISPSSTDLEHPETSSWEEFCNSNLSRLNAQAVLRVTNVSREAAVPDS